MKIRLLYIFFISFIFNNTVIEEKHPCLMAGEMGAMVLIDAPIYYSSSNYKSNISAFNLYAKSTYLFNLYDPIMGIVRSIINDNNYIDLHNNPRYYFIKAIEDLYDNDLVSSKKYLNKFLTFSDNYLNDINSRKKYFTQGCSLDDISWIKNYKKSKEFELAMLLDKYLNNSISHLVLIEEIQALDSNRNIFDLYDNIIFIIMKNHNYNINNYRDFFSNNHDFQLTQLLYDDGVNYVISSQISALSMFKYFEAEKYLMRIKDKESIYFKYLDKEFDEYSNKYLYPLMYFFELNNTLFNNYDSELFLFIKNLIDEISIEYELEPANQLNVWVELFDVTNKDVYESFKNEVNKYKEFLILNKNNIGLTIDSKNINHKFNQIIMNNESTVDSIIFTKVYQELNSENFFYDISTLDYNSYWIPEISDSLKKSLKNNMININSLEFSEKFSIENKKMIEVSFMPYFIYDIYNEVNLKENILDKVNPQEKINDGNSPLFFSLNELNKILNPQSGSNSEEDESIDSLNKENR